MSEIRLPFGVDGSGGIAKESDPVRLAGQHLTSALGTTPGERVMRGDYGSTLQAHAFGVGDDDIMDMLEMDLRAAAAQFVGDASVVSIDAPQPDVSGFVKVRVQFVLNTTGEADAITLTTRDDEENTDG